MHRADSSRTAAEQPAASLTPPPVPETASAVPPPIPAAPVPVPVPSVSSADSAGPPQAQSPPSSPAAAVGWSLSPAPAKGGKVIVDEAAGSAPAATAPKGLPQPVRSSVSLSPAPSQSQAQAPVEVPEEEEEEVLRMPTRIGNPKRSSAGKGSPALGGRGPRGGALVSEGRTQMQPPHLPQSQSQSHGAPVARRTSAGPALGSPALMYSNPMQRPEQEEEFGDDDEEEGKGASRFGSFGPALCIHVSCLCVSSSAGLRQHAPVAVPDPRGAPGHVLPAALLVAGQAAGHEEPQEELPRRRHVHVRWNLLVADVWIRRRCRFVAQSPVCLCV